MDKVTSRGFGIVMALVLAVPAARAQAPAAKPAAAPAPAPAGKPAAAPAAGAPAAAAPMAPPKPAAEMDQLKFFVGKWKCDGKMFASPIYGPEHAFKAAAEAKVDGGGHWQAFTYEWKKAKDHPSLKIHGTWGWDAGNKRFVRAAADDMGTWDSATSPGFQGDKLVWTGELSGPMGKMPFHHTFTKKSDKEWVGAFEVKTPDGKWAPMDETTCKK
jgi:hypothetical protein